MLTDGIRTDVHAAGTIVTEFDTEVLISQFFSIALVHFLRYIAHTVIHVANNYS